MQVRGAADSVSVKDDPSHIANELVERCKGDASLLDKVLTALQRHIRRIAINNILKGN